MRPGDIVIGKYRVDSLIGEGGMGEVFAATELDIGRPVAIKRLSPKAASIPGVVDRFRREAQVTALLGGSHHVIRIFYFGHIDGLPFIVMELLRGHDLAKELDKRKKVPMREAIGYVMQACVALTEAHSRGIIHRDIKPGNLFLSRNIDGTIEVKVLDFGISKIASDNANQVDLTKTTTVLGSLRYMSPEQIRSSKHIDHRSDIWSLGVILYQLVAGERPFPSSSESAVLAEIVADPPRPIRELEPSVPPAFEWLILRCLEKDPQRRPANVLELARGLRAFAPETQRILETIERIAAAPALSVVTREERAEPSSTAGPAAMAFCTESIPEKERLAVLKPDPEPTSSSDAALTPKLPMEQLARDLAPTPSGPLPSEPGHVRFGNDQSASSVDDTPLDDRSLQHVVAGRGGGSFAAAHGGGNLAQDAGAGLVPKPRPSAGSLPVSLGVDDLAAQAAIATVPSNAEPIEHPSDVERSILTWLRTTPAPSEAAPAPSEAASAPSEAASAPSEAAATLVSSRAEALEDPSHAEHSVTTRSMSADAPSTGAKWIRYSWVIAAAIGLLAAVTVSEPLWHSKEQQASPPSTIPVPMLDAGAGLSAMAQQRSAEDAGLGVTEPTAAAPAVAAAPAASPAAIASPAAVASPAAIATPPAVATASAGSSRDDETRRIKAGPTATGTGRPRQTVNPPLVTGHPPKQPSSEPSILKSMGTRMNEGTRR